MNKVFHEIKSDRIENVLQNGLQLTSGGDKRDKDINKTDEFLNEYRPKYLVQRGVDRKTNTYCYLASGNEIIDITSGESKSPQEIISDSQHALLQIEIEPGKCYVSDLDIYDQVKELLGSGNDTQAQRLAQTYWNELQLFADYNKNIRLPEIMVTYAVPPSHITRVI